MWNFNTCITSAVCFSFSSGHWYHFLCWCLQVQAFRPVCPARRGANRCTAPGRLGLDWPQLSVALVFCLRNVSVWFLFRWYGSQIVRSLLCFISGSPTSYCIELNTLFFSSLLWVQQTNKLAHEGTSDIWLGPSLHLRQRLKRHIVKGDKILSVIYSEAKAVVVPPT
jgi:hypothetical protein